MSQAARLFQICRLLSTGRTVTAQSLQDQLEVARATIYRDIAVLRDQLNAPIEWDAVAETYRFTPGPSVGDQFVVPGMHMTARQVYGMLTVVNIASALDPGVAEEFSLEYRGLLKQMMAAHDIPGYRLHEKVVVDLPAPTPEARAAMRVIGPALVTDTLVRLFAPSLGGNESLLVLPLRLRLRPDGWWLDYRHADGAEEASLPVADIVGAQEAAP